MSSKYPKNLQNTTNFRYYDIHRFVWRSDVRPAGRKLVLICLAFHCDGQASCFPHIATIARETNQGISTVKAHLTALVGMGIIRRNRQRYESGHLAGYRYFINVEVDNSKGQLSDLGEQCLGPELPSAYVQTSDHNKSQLNSNTTTVSAKELFSLLLEAAGDVVDERNQAIAIISEPIAWLSAKDPPDLHLDIIPTVARLSNDRPAQSIKSWRFFRDAIFEARDFRLSSPDISYEKNNANSNRNNQRGPGNGSKYSTLDNATEAAIRRAQQNTA